MREILGIGMVTIALATLFQKSVLRAVMLRLVLSILAVALYTVYMAPDVGLAEAMIGALLMTYVYMLLIKSPRSIIVGVVPLKILFEKHPWGFDGIEYVLLERFAKSHGYSLEIIEYENESDLLESLKNGEIDAACGPVHTQGIQIIPTKIFVLEDGHEKDFLRMSEEDSKRIVNVKETFYTILMSEHVEEFQDFLENLKRSGEFDEIIYKYAR